MEMPKIDSWTLQNKGAQCPDCGGSVAYHEEEDGFWCEKCLRWFMAYCGALIPFDEVAQDLRDKADPALLCGVEQGFDEPW
jgi:tRNA(Ile2) C34 agmatinyltransferase TiaS